MMGLPDCQKSFKIGLAVLIQYRHVTDSKPRCCSKDRTYVYVARVKIYVNLKNYATDLEIFNLP